jgi:hypothetical protein
VRGAAKHVDNYILSTSGSAISCYLGVFRLAEKLRMFLRLCYLGHLLSRRNTFIRAIVLDSHVKVRYDAGMSDTPIDETAFCPVCEFFPARVGKQPGHTLTYCSEECAAVANRRRANSPEAHARAFAMRNRDYRKAVIYRTRGAAKARGIEFNLTEADIPDMPTHCPVFPWIEIEYSVGAGRWSPNNPMRVGAPSLDRIDNSRGYVPGNVRIISLRANTLKNDATPEELFALADDAEKYYGTFFK